MSEPQATSQQPAAADPTKTHQAAEFKYSNPLFSCRFDPSGKYVYMGSYDRTVQRYELATGKTTSLAGHDSWVRAIAFHPHDGAVYTGGYEGRLIWWAGTADAPTPIRSVAAHQGWVRWIAVSPDGTRLATAGNDRLVKLWNAADGSLVREMAGHELQAYSVAFHPGGQFLVSGDLKGVVKQWDLADGKLVREFDAGALWKHDTMWKVDVGGVRGMSFSADGKSLVCSGLTEPSSPFGGVGFPLVLIFDWETGKKTQQFVSKEKKFGVAWNSRLHRDAFLATATAGQQDGYLYFWKLGETNELCSIKLPEVAADFDMHPDGIRLATVHPDCMLRIWQMSA